MFSLVIFFTPVLDVNLDPALQADLTHKGFKARLPSKKSETVPNAEFFDEIIEFTRLDSLKQVGGWLRKTCERFVARSAIGVPNHVGPFSTHVQCKSEARNFVFRDLLQLD